jgi:hypothetical protein
MAARNARWAAGAKARPSTPVIVIIPGDDYARTPPA